MSRRLPKDIPQLKPHDKPKKEEDVSRRKKGLVPHQERFSVQEVHNFEELNEEMRRLRPDFGKSAEADAGLGGGGAGAGRGLTPKPKPDSGSGDGDGSAWALTVKHNDNIIGKPKEIQGLNFKDVKVINSTLLPIIFKLKAQELERQLIEGIANGIDSQVEIKGYAQLGIQSGIIYLNKLPSSIAETPMGRDVWKRQGYNFNPSNGKYGWAVYNYIDPGWTLANVNDFIINIVDLHAIFVRDGLTELELAEVLAYVEANAPGGTELEQRQFIEEYFALVYPGTKGFEPQVCRPEIEGQRILTLDSNNFEISKDIIILRAVYKPDLYNYYGGDIPTRTADIVENGIVRTNIVFWYTLMRK